MDFSVPVLAPQCKMMNIGGVDIIGNPSSGVIVGLDEGLVFGIKVDLCFLFCACTASGNICTNTPVYPHLPERKLRESKKHTRGSSCFAISSAIFPLPLPQD